MYRIAIFSLFIVIVTVFCEDDDKKYRKVDIDEGAVVGEKYWDGDFFEFYGVPYATVPTGRDRFKGPLSVKPREHVLGANNKKIMCHQTFYTPDADDDFIHLGGEEDCLAMNLLVPEIATEENLVPVMVYVHSGAFAGGNGNMAKYHYLARRDVIVISFNYRLGAIGFACLGNEMIPGNAGMKDAVAALRWINKNIKKFGGDPDKVTLAGFSVGAAMAELLALSKTTDGLIDKLILDSGSALSPYAVNRDPLSTALNIAKSIGYNGTTFDELTEFYLNAKADVLAAKSLNFFLPNSTFGFAPCIENNIKDVEPFLTEDPLKIMQEGKFKKLPVLTGFSNKEGLSRVIKFDEWSKKMNEDLTDFLPADLKFDNVKSRDEFIKKVRDYYFKNKKISEENFKGYVDYFSDSMFKYSIMKSAKLHASKSPKPVFFYEFSYVGTLSTQHRFMDKLKAASHRDQTSYILDFYSFTNEIGDLTMRDRLTWMWTDFVKYGNPTAYESELVDYKWQKYTEKEQDYLHIDLNTEMKQGVFKDGYDFWNKVYEKFYFSAV
ncbi:carboxylesterase family domain-containing protein [Phthorimaea operculella]|nr:carboxylesterase family domain-containing protein [Phthorimaea operculella]